jgi:glycosyltransferase involved in cell wall biosynthesis
VPFFSIIIPTFNSASTLAQTLNSVLLQSFADLEILICDGKSGDRTLDIILEYQVKDNRINYISEPDKGIYDAMNKGISKAKGKWLLFLGSDDQLYDGNVLKSAFDFLNNTVADLVYGNVQLQGDASWAQDGIIYDGEFSKAKLFEKNICHQAIFYSAGIFNKVGTFNINYNICADWDFNLRSFAFCKVQYIDLVIAKFIGGGQSTSAHDKLFTPRERVFNIKKYYNLSFYNRQFKKFSYIFFNEAYRGYADKKYAKAFQFGMIYLYHYPNKLLIIKLAFRKLFKLFGYQRKSV